MNGIIEVLKNLRKQSYLKLAYKGSYAFVGIGNHSIHNLYPVLNYLRVPLKYIVVNSDKNAQSVNSNFQGIEGTTDFDKVLNDETIRGVFICASPKSHFALTKKALQHNKNVFVEKPPCTTKAELQELISTEKNSEGFCLTGMQKRYSPVIQALKKNLSGTVSSYNYRFVTGPYPEGDSALDIYIHPLDLISYLFGKFTVASVQVSNKHTVFVHLNHGGFTGSIELSTNYGWKSAEENLIVNTEKGIYKMQNLEQLTFDKKTGTLFSIPIEKIKKTNEETRILFNRNNFNPIINNNQLFTSGYVDELKNFVSLCETGKGENLSTLTELITTYELIDTIKK